MEKPRSGHALRFLIFSAVLAVVVLAVLLTPLKDELAPERLKDLADRLSSGKLFPLLYFLLTAAGVSIMLPAFAFVAGAGLIFGPVRGALLMWPAVTTGALIAFFCGRSFLHGFIQRHIHKMKLLDRLNKSTHENGFLFSLIARLILIVPWNIFNYAASLTSIRWKDYALGTAIGILPEIVVMSMLGSAIKNAGKKPQGLIIPIVCNIAIMSIALIIKRKMTGRKNGHS